MFPNKKHHTPTDTAHCLAGGPLSFEYPLRATTVLRRSRAVWSGGRRAVVGTTAAAAVMPHDSHMPPVPIFLDAETFFLYIIQHTRQTRIYPIKHKKKGKITTYITNK